MGARTGLLAVIPAIVLIAACGRVTDATPTAPSPITSNPVSSATPAPEPAQNFPSLTGRWRASGRNVYRNLENGNTLGWGGCSGSFTITEQDAGTFTGTFGTQGSGWNSDRFCTASGTFTGELLVPDGSVAQARLGNSQNWPRPSVTPSCEFVSRGDGIWTGSAISDEIHLQTSDILRCPVNGDGGMIGMPMADFERTVSLTFLRW